MNSRDRHSQNGPARASASEDGQLPPHSPELETATLGAILLDPDGAANRIRQLKPAHFFTSQCREILGTLKEIVDGGIVPDEVTLCDRLRRVGALERVGGHAFVAGLADTVPSPLQFEGYLADLQAYSRRRELIRLASHARNLALDTTTDLNGASAEFAAMAQQIMQDGRDESALPPFQPAGEFVAADIPEPPEVVRGILHQGAKMILGGGSKSFKTWTLLHLGLCISQGEPWLRFKTTRGRVLFINFELQAFALKKRLEAIAQARNFRINDDLVVWNLRGHSASYDVILPEITRRIRGEGFGLVILDPFYKLLGNADENSNSEIGLVCNEVERLATRTGAAVAYGSHFSKGNQAAKTSIDRISGAGTFARDPDSILTFTQHEADGAFVVEPCLRNFPPVAPFVVRWQYPIMRRDDNLNPAALRQPSKPGRKTKFTAEALVEILGAEALEAPDWLRLANKRVGIGKSTFYDLLAEIKDRGLAVYESETWRAAK